MLVVGAEQLDHVVELPQDLLEPQLVDLVHDDEQQLVVLRAVRSGHLETEQIVDPEIARVRDGGIAHSPSVAPSGASQ